MFLLGALMLTTISTSSAVSRTAYFCSQFYGRIDIENRIREPLRLVVNDSVPVGHVLHKFRPDSTVPERGITFLPNEKGYVEFNATSYDLLAGPRLRHKAGKTLIIRGSCADLIEPIALSVSLPVSIFIHVEDVNDPPVFINLPTTVQVGELEKFGSFIYWIHAEDIFDIKANFKDTKLYLENATADDGSDVTSWFRLRSRGKLFLKAPLDYERGPRSIKLSVIAKDAGRPPLVNRSLLTIEVVDEDDQAPAFTSKLYQANLDGEKPIQAPEECLSTEPAVMAEDKDPVAASPLTYSVISGKGDENADWKEFIRLDPTSGMLCQKARVPRSQRQHKVKPDFLNFTLLIQVQQRDDPTKADIATLKVKVQDVNQHAPEFSKEVYTVDIPEFPGVKTGHRLLRLKAKDKDYGINGKFKYEILGRAPEAVSLDPVTGLLTVVQPELLDREQNEKLEFKVQAIETQSGDYKKGIARVVITITDLNDNSPVFTQPAYEFTVKDNHKPGRPLHQPDAGLRATDADQGINGNLLYRINNVKRLQGKTTYTDQNRFVMNARTGSLRLDKTLHDLRRLNQYPKFLLQVRVTDLAQPKSERRSSKADVFIQIIPANEYPPRFSRLPPGHVILVQENDPVGKIIYLAKAKDKDGDEDIFLKYSITDGDPDGSFNISNSGQIAIQRKLDRETSDRYNLTVQVTDGKHTAKANFLVNVVDSNDNAPKFFAPSYHFHIPEHSYTGTAIGKVKAIDNDLGPAGEISYKIIGTDYFKVTWDGKLSVAHQGPLLDRERNNLFQFLVEAEDKGSPRMKSSVAVNVHILDQNDNPPKFTRHHYTGSVVEDDVSPTEQVVLMDFPINASDADMTASNRDIRFFLIGPDRDMFDIDPTEGRLKVKTAGTVDCEKQQEYHVKVLARDRGGSGLQSESDVTIKVIDVNDNSPVFKGNHTITVDENSPVGVILGKVEAHDSDVTGPNNYVMYLLTNGGYGKFKVDFDTGVIRLVEPLCSEPQLTRYTLSVVAIDAGSPRRSSSTDIKLRLPSNTAPKIAESSKLMKVKEGQPVGTMVGKVVVRDPNFHGLTFKITENNIPFKISKSNGEVTTTEVIDREMFDMYRFTVTVTDHGCPVQSAFVILTVRIQDVNDVAPKFLLPYYEGTVVEDDVKPKYDQPVIMANNVSAIDGDATAKYQKFKYSLQGDDHKLFHIHPRTGHVIVSQFGSGRINRERQNRYKLKLIVKDGGGLSSESVLVIKVLDENDSGPLFPSKFLRIRLPPYVRRGQRIATVRATDGDADRPNNRLVYFIENKVQGKFRLDMWTGVLAVQDGLFLPPMKRKYNLLILVSDLGKPPRKSEMMIEVIMPSTILHNSPPRFVGNTIFEISEGLPAGSVVGQLTLSGLQDKTMLPVTMKIQKNPFKKPERQWLAEELQEEASFVPFTVDDNGTIMTTAAMDFDHGPSYYKFFVKAANTGNPGRTDVAEVGVVIKDVNDNPPKFSSKVYHQNLPVKYKAGTIIAAPFAYDNIDTVQSTYIYSMTGKYAEYFQINPNTGVVQTGKQLNPLPTGIINLTVIAKDKENPILSAETSIMIDVFG